MKHRGVDFNVEEDPPSFWHWKIVPEAGPMVIGDMKFQTRGNAVDACIVRPKLKTAIKPNWQASQIRCHMT
jgi:hypothetical protein